MATAAAAIDSTYDIVTPENIEFEYQVAGPLRRMPAFLLDVVFRALIFIVIAVVCGLVGGLIIGLTMTEELGELLFAFILVAWFVLEWLYGGLFETFWNGQTPGKRLLGLRVLTTHGEPINGLQAMSRNFLRFADAWPGLPVAAFGYAAGVEELTMLPWIVPTFIVALVVSGMNRRRQRVGDIVSQTMVIVEERNWLFGMVKMEDPRVRELAAQLPVHVDIGRSTAQALAMYVERRRYFSPPRRQEIAMHLGQPLIERYHLPPQADHDLLLCAIYYKVFFTEGLDEEPANPYAAPPAENNPYVITEAPQIDTGPRRSYR